MLSLSAVACSTSAYTSLFSLLRIVEPAKVSLVSDGVTPKRISCYANVAFATEHNSVGIISVFFEVVCVPSVVSYCRKNDDHSAALIDLGDLSETKLRHTATPGKEGKRLLLLSLID
jgi:hypothetical protein